MKHNIYEFSLFLKILYFISKGSSNILEYQGAETSYMCKVLMQGKLIAVAYTLRTYWNQFSLGGICNQK